MPGGPTETRVEGFGLPRPGRAQLHESPTGETAPPGSAATYAKRPYLAGVILALLMAVVTFGFSLDLGIPLRDPDGVAGSPAVRLSIIAAIFFVLDVVPRALARARWRLDALRSALVAVVRERWTWRRSLLVLTGLLSFYLTYICYRNLKSFLPFVQEGLHDGALLGLDRAMAFGKDPAALAQEVLGVGVIAHALSSVYLFFLLFVPISVAAALVWTTKLAEGFWYVTSLNLNWALGVLSYYVVPSLGPAFFAPSVVSSLPSTGVSRLQEALLEHRLELLAAPHTASDLQSIAGFASLHVSIVFTAAVIAQLLGVARVVRLALWAFLGLTLVATVYFGWHYVIDDVAGLLLGLVAVWLGAMATGQSDRLVPMRARLSRRSPASAQSAA